MEQPLLIIKLNAYGYRWHVLRELGKGIAFSGRTLMDCKHYCRRHGLKWTRQTSTARS